MLFFSLDKLRVLRQFAFSSKNVSKIFVLARSRVFFSCLKRTKLAPFCYGWLTARRLKPRIEGRLEYFRMTRRWRRDINFVAIMSKVNSMFIP